MKKTLAAFFCASLLALAATSCQKEEMDEVNHAWTAPGNWSKNTFSASFSTDNSKTSIVNYNVIWNQLDQIRIANSAGEAVNYSVRTIASNGTDATFSVPEGSTEITGDHFVATYPTSFNGSTITLPQVQHYDADKGIVDFPMYAESDSRNLQFHNLCGVLELTLQKANIRIKQIFITTDQPITGNFNIETEGGYKCVKSTAASGNNNNSVLLDCGNGVLITNSTKFYIYLPVATFTSKFDIEIVTNGNATYSLKKINNDAMAFQRNRVKTISISNPTFKKAPDLGGYGLYTVNDSGNRVYFAHGNLFYKLECKHKRYSWSSTYITDSAAYWGFYEKQYGGWQKGAQFDEFVPTSNGTYSNYAQTNNNDQYKSDRLSYFTWGYNATYSITYNSEPASQLTGNPQPNNTWAEWCDNISIKGSTSRNWRTLSRDEWHYLINTRTMFFGAPRFVRVKLMGVDKLYDDNNHTSATVNVKGLLLYPDRYPTDDPNNHPFFNDDPDSWRQINKDQWEKMEKAGCVFLPATGYRQGTAIKAIGRTDNMFGLYQSSSIATGDYANEYTAGLLWGVLATSASHPDLIGYLANNCAHNVRLVMDENYGQEETTSPQYPII